MCTHLLPLFKHVHRASFWSDLIACSIEHSMQLDWRDESAIRNVRNFHKFHDSQCYHSWYHMRTSMLAYPFYFLHFPEPLTAHPPSYISTTNSNPVIPIQNFPQCIWTTFDPWTLLLWPQRHLWVKVFEPRSNIKWKNNIAYFMIPRITKILPFRFRKTLY